MPLIVLDRDGVVNFDSPDFIKTPDEWRPIPGSIEAVARLTAAGWDVFVASNQSGVGRGLITPDNLNEIHARMYAAVTAAGGVIRGTFFCPHKPEAGCDCRKPLPGLFRQIERAAGVSVTDAPAVGDSMRDIEAARAAGALPLLVRTGNGAGTEAELGDDSNVDVFDDLSAVVDTLLK